MNDKESRKGNALGQGRTKQRDTQSVTEGVTDTCDLCGDPLSDSMELEKGVCNICDETHIQGSE